MSRNPPPPRRMVHSVMSEMRDKVDLKLKGKQCIIGYKVFATYICGELTISNIKCSLIKCHKMSNPKVDFLSSKFILCLDPDLFGYDGKFCEFIVLRADCCKF